ncbi:MAG: hypothetical protein ACTHJN_10075 [Ginsengibacter sp.]
MNKIVITKIPLRYFHYFQYLIFGFQKLENGNKIDFKLESVTFKNWLFYRFYFLFIVLFKFSKKFRSTIKNEYLMEGYFYDGRQKVNFCYDIADSPHYYDVEKLKKTDVYFKAQCPIEFKDIGFELTSDAILPYSPGTLKYLNKIKPSMLAPGFGVNNMFAFKRFRKKYDEMFVSQQTHRKSLMCFFGNSKGNMVVKSDNPDLYNNESHILGYYGEKVEHPNIKRGIAAQLITKLLPDSDARIMHDGNCDVRHKPRKNTLFIPMEDFPLHISQFKYNLNISGHRMSIPYRFIHSFTVGTAIITDKLKLRWYLPFGPEVIETVEMGYLPAEKVNWDGFKKQIVNLPETKPQEILNAFHKKWSPEAFAEYLIDTCKIYLV